MKDILSGYTKQELERIITHTDLTMNETIKEKFNSNQEITQDKVSKIVFDVLTSYEFKISRKDDKKRIEEIISRSNPYRIFEFINDLDFLIHLLDTYLNKSWQTHFGNILEKISCSIAGGTKSSQIGMDIDIPNKNIFLGSKSGPNWANSDQRKSMLRNSKVLVEGKGAKVYVICAYGKGKKEYEFYTQVAGQEAWELISGNENMYEIVFDSIQINNKELQKLKDKVCGDFKQVAIDFWKENFYTNNKFNKKKYLDYVSKK